MTEIEKVFNKNKKENKVTKIIYITAGYPDIKTTKKLILELEKIGTDIIELGFPFSDPMADGPVIQTTSYLALKNNYRIDDYFLMVKEVRKITNIPLVIMTYANIVYHYGYENFIKKSKISGINGFIIPDMSIEDIEKFSSMSNKNNLANIVIVSENSNDYRLKKLLSLSSGFVYVVSQPGVTGKKINIHKKLIDLSKKIKRMTNLPISVGFGISKKEDIDNLKKYFDGIIIGSAFLKRMLDNNGKYNSAISYLKDMYCRDTL